MHVKQLAWCQAPKKCSRNKVISSEFLSFSLPIFSFRGGTSLGVITSNRRLCLSILILLIFVCVFRSHLIADLMQGRYALSLFHCFEIRRVDDSVLSRTFS